MRREIVKRLRRAGCYGSLVVCLLLASAVHAEAPSLGSDVRSAIQQLRQAVALSRAGQPQEAHKALDGIAALVVRLSQEGTRYRDAARDEQQRCVTRVGELDLKIGQLFSQEREATQHITSLDATLAKAMEDRALSEREIAAIDEQIAQAQADANQREQKLRELARWWWVPGYGQFLAIRALVDNDTGNLRSLAGTLQDKRSQLQHRQAALEAAHTTLCAASEERERLQASTASLSCMRGVVHARAAELKQMTVFLLDSVLFWRQLEGLSSISIEEQRKNLELTYELLSQTRDAINFVHAEIAAQTSSMEKLLIELADSLDAGANIVLQNPTDYCLLDVPSSHCAAVQPTKPSQPALAASSFARTCSDARMTSEKLVARCKKRDGVVTEASVALRGLANMNGSLVFVNGASSFQRSCQDSFMCGSTLRSRCKRHDGSLANTSAEIRGIHNMDGKLTY